jgi:hypothetical protein
VLAAPDQWQKAHACNFPIFMAEHRIIGRQNTMKRSTGYHNALLYDTKQRITLQHTTIQHNTTHMQFAETFIAMRELSAVHAYKQHTSHIAPHGSRARQHNTTQDKTFVRCGEVGEGHAAGTRMHGTKKKML